ncbi:MAG: hypothetical protein E2O80_06280 [Betaproteobacteria bacterium]|jgi:ketopantoate hydroxymethyltransferase|nr:MAG: hypothetical protein E2O86_04000 [Bacteroidota bacterium]TDI80620.1 MAG: hypothetical protein E2O80_06280 [Betaproteobacteria bacterium]
MDITGKRKIIMMGISYSCVSILTLAYIFVMAHLKLEPSSTVLMVIFGILGGGHMTANQANSHEHKKNV